MPNGRGKGCLSFTTQERDHIISKDAGVRASIEAVKKRFLVGLHHNWHDAQFVYDPLFDFSMAGEGDLIAKDGSSFPYIPLDACNFAPPSFDLQKSTEPFWDVLNVSRAVFFKGIPEFLKAIRAAYDQKRFIRVLHLCPVPPAQGGGTTVENIRDTYEALFSSEERKLFTLMTMEWDYPFPLDMETLAFFYRSSRVYVHAAPEERRCRTAAYAWASGMPVVARENVASIVPQDSRREPFCFLFDKPAEMTDALLRAVDYSRRQVSEDRHDWAPVASEFQTEQSALRLSSFLDALGAARGEPISDREINSSGLDIRLGRHHGLAAGPNGLSQQVSEFCSELMKRSDAELAALDLISDPEMALASTGVRRDAFHAHNSAEVKNGFMPALARSSWLWSFLKAGKQRICHKLSTTQILKR